MVTRALDYIGDILKHIKPVLVSKNQEGLQLAYWAVGKRAVHLAHTQVTGDRSSGALCFFVFTMCSESHAGRKNYYSCVRLSPDSVLCDPGCVVKHWSPLLATSKAQQLLFRIVDSLLLPHHLTQQDKALRDTLPLYLQVRTGTYCTLGENPNHNQNPVITHLSLLTL